LLVLALLWPASGLLAQALPEPPPPLPTDTEIALAQTSDVREIVMKAREWDEAGDLRRLTYALERLVQLRPYNGPFLYRLAQSYARQDMKTPAYDLLLRIQA
ncbi:hypothetical protein RZS08_04445, partial [Arthrospira platensis SPKY1]|nr:hypothetical protein [Arthrospira platensis SPKY1]